MPWRRAAPASSRPSRKPSARSLMHEANQEVTLAGTIEGALFAEGAPESLQAYVVRLTDGQRLQTNVRNLRAVVSVPMVAAPDLVPTAFYGRHEPEPVPEP